MTSYRVIEIGRVEEARRPSGVPIFNVRNQEGDIVLEQVTFLEVRAFLQVNDAEVV